MKKAWIILIALALLAFSMPIFADAPAAGSFHAWNQGNLFPYYQIGSNAASMGWGPQWDTVKGIDQEWTFSYDGNNYGFNATFEFGMDNFGNDVLLAPGPGAQISWFATYYKFGDLVKVTIGKPRFNDYTEFSQVEGNNYKRFGDSDFMGIVQLFPITGLSFAGALYVPNTLIGAAGNAALGTSPDYGSNFGVAAAYAMPNLVSLKVMYRANEGTMGDTGTTTKIVGAGVNVSAVQGLTLNAALQADLSSSSYTELKAFVSVGTKMVAPLALALDVALDNNKAGANNTAFAVEANAEYPIMGQWVLGANVGYDGGANNSTVNWFNQGVGDWTGIEIYPYVKANFDNGSSLKIGFVYGSADSAGASNAVIAVPIIYVWSF